MIRQTVFFFLVLLAPTASRLLAGPMVSLRTEAAPREIYIGDRIQIRVTVDFSTSVAASPMAVSLDTAAFELLNAESSQPKLARPDTWETVHTLTLTSFSTGQFTIPGFPIQFKAPNGSVSEAKTESVTITVKSLLKEKGDEENIRPLKGLFNFKSYLWIWILLGVLLVLVAGFFGWRWVTGRRFGLEAPPGPPRPPEELAWEALHALEDADLAAQGQIKEFYYRLSLILRTYLENRYAVSALDRTSSELLAEFRHLMFSMDLMNLTRDFFDNADLVKFAKFTPTEEEVTGDLNRVKHFINLTTPPKTKEKVDEKEALPV